MHQRRQVREPDGMDARQDLAELARDHRPRLLVGRIAQELARDRRAGDAPHHEAFPQPVLGAELEQHLRRPHAAFVGGGQHAKLGGAVQRRGRGGAGLARRRRIATQNQAVALAVHHHIEAPGLARGAARFPLEPLDRSRPPEMPAGRAGEGGCDLIGFGGCVNGHSPDCGTGPGAW
jgi:hypothetical protein